MGNSNKGKTTLKIQPSGSGWLYRSVVAVLYKMISVEDLCEEIQKEVARDILIRAMGGRNILITFPSFDIKDEMEQEGLA